MSIRRDELIDQIVASQKNRGFFDLDKIADEYKLFSVMLSDEGWYLDYDLAVETLSSLYIKQVKTKSNVLDKYLVDFYTKKLNIIINFFQKEFPKRYSILEKAFEAHKKGDFELSIPVFLSQIEGLFFDLTNKEIFSKGKTKENTAKKWLEERDGHDVDFRLSILEPLRKNENISASFKESENFPNALNRNKILHGRDLSYSTEINSYKAISLLLFIGTIVYDTVNE
jgi:hypothetical protein